jgi:hypothetical protein
VRRFMELESWEDEQHFIENVFNHIDEMCCFRDVIEDCLMITESIMCSLW